MNRLYLRTVYQSNLRRQFKLALDIILLTLFAQIGIAPTGAEATDQAFRAICRRFGTFARAAARNRIQIAECSE